jgi:hypothetical protein
MATASTKSGNSLPVHIRPLYKIISAVIIDFFWANRDIVKDTAIEKNKIILRIVLN